MQTLRGEGREHTMKLTDANYEWLRERAHRERKSQALVLNEVLDAAQMGEVLGMSAQAMASLEVGMAAHLLTEHLRKKKDGGDG